MTRFVLVRHGQTEWNKDPRFRGRIDIELDATGMRQAEALATRLATDKLVAIYSSPLRRAIMTAEPTSRRLGLPVQVEEGINDMDFGSWEGRSVSEVAQQDKELFELWRVSPEQIRMPGGETLDSVRQRAVAAVDAIAARHDDQAVLLVTHRVVCKVLLCHFFGLDNSHFWQIEQNTAAINYFHVMEKRSTITMVNDTCHLRAI